MAHARVYVGAHYPGDVLGGAVVGILVAIVLMRLVAVVPRKLTDVADFVLVRLRLLGEHVDERPASPNDPADPYAASHTH